MAGLAALLKAPPNCRIKWDDPAANRPRLRRPGPLPGSSSGPFQHTAGLLGGEPFTRLSRPRGVNLAVSRAGQSSESVPGRRLAKRAFCVNAVEVAVSLAPRRKGFFEPFAAAIPRGVTAGASTRVVADWVS